MIYLVNENKTKQNDPIYASKINTPKGCCMWIPCTFAHCLDPEWYSSPWEAQRREAKIFADLCPKKEELRGKPGGKGLGRYIWEGTQREGKLRMYGQLFHSVSWVHLVWMLLCFHQLTTWHKDRLWLAPASSSLVKPSAHWGGSARGGPTPNDKPGDTNELCKA